MLMCRCGDRRPTSYLEIFEKKEKKIKKKVTLQLMMMMVNWCVDIGRYSFVHRCRQTRPFIGTQEMCTNTGRSIKSI